MRILVLGGNGMLGHKVFQALRVRFPLTACTIRGSASSPLLRGIDLFQGGSVFEGIGVSDLTPLQGAFAQYRPEIIINCIGLIKQRPEAQSPALCMAVNSEFPRRLSELARRSGARLLHFSTDCVFSGRRGCYREEDASDVEDPYGKSKSSGEVAAPHVLTLRTSFIGRELSSSASLLEWFLGQNGRSVKGFTRSVFSGVTTNFVGRMLVELLERHPSLSGLYHLAGQAITKHDLLCLLRSAFAMNVEISPDDSLRCDRSLDGNAFSSTTGIQVPRWPELVHELAQDPTPYDMWRGAYETA